MFKVRKLVLLGITAVLMLVLVACGGDTQGSSPNEGNPGATLTVRQLLESPLSLNSEVSVIGTTQNDGRHSFALAQDGVAIPLLVDYRGSQALPAYGIEVIVTGQVMIDCCDNVYIRAVSYEVVE